MLEIVVGDTFWYALLTLCAAGMFLVGSVCGRNPKLYWLVLPAVVATVLVIDHFSWC